VKLTITRTFDFNKLQKSMKNMISDLTQESIKKEAAQMKERLVSGKTISGSMKKLSDSAKVTRILRGQNPSAPPLNATGALTRSIKATNKGISGKDYAIHHNFGFTTKNNPLIPEGNKKPKGGLRKKVFMFKGKSIPARKFMHNESTYMYDKIIVENFFKAIRRNFKK